MNLSETILNTYFGPDFKSYDLNDSERSKQKPLFLTREEICNPTKEKYLLLKKMIRLYRENNPLYNKLDNLIHLLAAMTAAIPDDVFKEWDNES